MYDVYMNFAQIRQFNIAVCMYVCMYLSMYVCMYICTPLWVYRTNICTAVSLHPRAGYGDLTRYRCELATFIHSFIRSPNRPLRSAPLTPAAAARRSRTCWGRPPAPYIQFYLIVVSMQCRPAASPGGPPACRRSAPAACRPADLTRSANTQTHRQTWYIESHSFPTRTTICPLRRTNTYIHR